MRGNSDFSITLFLQKSLQQSISRDMTTAPDEIELEFSRLASRKEFGNLIFNLEDNINEDFDKNHKRANKFTNEYFFMDFKRNNGYVIMHAKDY